MRKLPPLASLRAFEAAARHLSFKAAAAELGVTPTAISHQIRLLEETCGRPLFQRRPRPLRLTRVGERLFPVLRNGLDAFASAIASVNEGPGQGPLRVTSPNAFAGRWLVPRLPLWREAHPEIPLDVIGTDAVLDLRAGDADVAIRYAYAMPTDLPAQEICRDVFFPMCAPELLASAAHPIKRAAELLRCPLIHYECGPERTDLAPLAGDCTFDRSRPAGSHGGLGPELSRGAARDRSGRRRPRHRHLQRRRG